LPEAAAWAGGTVYAMTNAIGNNQILVYHRSRTGVLSLVQTIATGGGGGGPQLNPPVDSLGSQGGLMLDQGHNRLFAVNTETLAANSQDCQQGSITSFTVADNGRLKFADRVFSRGMYPDSLTVKGTANPGNDAAEILYVLNAGGPGNHCNQQPLVAGVPNVTGFRVDTNGYMTPIAGAKQKIDPGPPDGTGSGENCNPGGFPKPDFNCGRNPPAFPRSPAQVRFTPDGSQLVVTVKGTNSIYVFSVDANDGNIGNPTVTQATGPALPTDFGIAFDAQEHLLITEAFGRATSIPTPGAGAVSSYQINKNGTLVPISKSVGDGGTAACWIALEPATGNFAYVANNLSPIGDGQPNSISSYKVGRTGSLTLLKSNAVGAVNGPNDLAVVADGSSSYLYVLDSGDGQVDAFIVSRSDGSLTPLAAFGGLPANQSAQGLAAY
jgi:6-phosphogluconolactonase (cycloisomerase 2 family)